jgi:hypothetical protein
MLCTSYPISDNQLLKYFFLQQKKVNYFLQINKVKTKLKTKKKNKKAEQHK